MQYSEEKKFKILLLGEETVEKPNIISSYTHEEFNLSTLNTIGISYALKKVIIDNKEVTLELWDFKGQERFRGNLKFNFRKSDAILFLYNINEKGTYYDLTRLWLYNLDSELQRYFKPVILVGNIPNNENKREISFYEAYNTAKKMNMPFYELNSQTGNNIENLFNFLIRELLRNYNNKGINGYLTEDNES